MQVTKADAGIFNIRSTSSDDFVYNELRHIFTPHIVINEKSIPNVSDLISMPRRFYIKPLDDVKEDSSPSEQNVSHSIANNTSKEYNNTAGVLDLGTASLQRIVTNMKGINFDEDTTSFKFNPDAARLAGLKSYKDYSAAPHYAKKREFKYGSYDPKNAKPERVSSMKVGTNLSTKGGRKL